MGTTKELISDYDGVDVSLSKTSGFLTSLRIGDDTCGSMAPFSSSSSSPEKQVLVTFNGDVFFPAISTSAAATTLEKTLTVETFGVFDLDYNQVLRNPSCDVITSFSTVKEGYFSDITLYKDVAQGFPLRCPVSLPSVSDSCSGTFNSYFIDRTLPPYSIVHVDPTSKALVFD